MDYKQLQFFLAVCEAQSFRNAAARCYVSQQAISKSLSNLEQELGVQLFVRNQNGVSLTEAGQQLEKLARPHLNQRDEILRQMRSFHSKQQLHIGYFMGFLQELPPHFFPQFQEFHPEVQLHYHSYTDNERSRNYRNYDCDLVITTSPLSSIDFVQLAHFESDIGAILSRQNPLAQKHSLTLADLKEVPLITLNTENRSQTQLMERLQTMGLTIDSVLGDADWELVLDLLRQDFVSFYAGKASMLPADICFCPLQNLQLRWEFFIYGKRSHRVTSLQRELIQQILSAVSPH